MREKDRKPLTNMLTAARDAVGFAAAKSRSDLDTDKQLTLSLVKSLEMIGHSAALISRECKEGCEPIPWPEIIEMSRQVVHTYWEIDRDWVWETVTQRLPFWIDALDILLS